MDGWIKLHRRLLGWEWHTDANTLSVFVHLLLLAAHKPHEVDGITLDAGQIAISLRNFARLTGLSLQNVRTALAHLQATQQIAQQVTQQKTLITICKWANYQALFAEPNTAANTAANTHIQECIYQELDVATSAGACARKDVSAAAKLEELRKQLHTSPIKQEALQRSTRLPLGDALRLADEVFSDWDFQDEPASGITLAHLLGAIRIKADIERKQPQDVQTWKQNELARADKQLTAYFEQFKPTKN